MFGVDFDMLSPDLANMLRALDSPAFRIACNTAATTSAARLIAVDEDVDAKVTLALAEAAGTGSEIVAIGREELEVESLDAGAVDYVVWPSLNQSLHAQLAATARRLTRLAQQRGDFDRMRRFDALRLRIAKADVDLDTLGQLVCSELVASEDFRAMTRADGAVVELIDGEDLVYRAAAGAISGHLGSRILIANSLSQLVIDGREVLWSDDTEIDPRVNIDACRMVGVRSMAGAPLICDEKVVGVLKMVSTTPNCFGALDQRILRELADLLSASMRREMERDHLRGEVARKGEELQALEAESATLRTLATTDPLTGLLNRRQFVAAADEALRRGAGRRPGLAVVMLDLDQFKSVNDEHGHAAGDAVLVGVAEWLRATLRDGDILGRVGGEEFAIVLPRVDQAAALAAAERIRVAIEAGSVTVEGKCLRTTASIGVAIVAALTTQEEAFRRADVALYRAKTGGRNRIALHEDAHIVSFPGVGSASAK